MLYFSCDYAEGCHEKILERMAETNRVSTVGYGEDEFCKSAADKIRAYINKPEATVRFLVGGTQTNQTVIDSILTKYEGVVAAATGHVAVHEAGAIEFTGHKVLTLPQKEGKINAADLADMMETFYGDDSHDHMVFPGMVYISYPTEYGTIYSKAELTEIHDTCKKYNLPLFIDGARLGYGLACDASDVTMAELADLCEVFYIGGTKVGAMFGEAVVFCGMDCPKQFTTTIKQHGALLAKGRLLGVQFDTLFTDDLYMNVSKHAMAMAEKIKKNLASKGYKFFVNSPTNQIFVVMDNTKLESIKDQVVYSFWEKYDDSHTVIRIATSWATTEENVDALLEIL